MTRVHDPRADASMDVRVYFVRGYAVMLDGDLAEMFGVDAGAVNRAVWRHGRRFPLNSTFRLEPSEWKRLAGDSCPADNRGRPPRVFTGHGAIALAFVLDSREAAAASIRIVEAVVHNAHDQAADLSIPAVLEALAAAEADTDKPSMAAFRVLPGLVAMDGHKRQSPPKPEHQTRRRRHA